MKTLWLWILMTAPLLVLSGCTTLERSSSPKKIQAKELQKALPYSKKEEQSTPSKPLSLLPRGEKPEETEKTSEGASSPEKPVAEGKKEDQEPRKTAGGEGTEGLDQELEKSTPSSFPLSIERGKARVAIIIDDVGYSLQQIEPFLEIPAPLTFSLLPEAPQKRLCLQKILSQGRVAMLHLPMEPLSRRLMPPEAITTELSDQVIQSRVREWLSDLPGVKGVNNHMGSRATRDRRVMRAVLEVLKEEGLFFVDSRTIGDTVGSEVAEQLGVPYGVRDGRFLDDGGRTEEASEILLELGRIALEKGKAIGIGHPHPGTARAILQSLPVLRQQGVEIVPVTDLVR